MEDLGKYSYLIFLLIYLLYNFFTKSKDVKKQQPQTTTPDQERSFEDILREMMGQEKAKPPIKVETLVDTRKVNPNYSSNTNFEQQKSITKTQRTAPVSSNAEFTAEEENLQSRYEIIDEIHQGEFDFRKAIILSEILQRPRYV
ncbi:MAG: hypothetical protein ACK4GL_05885 [Flavobacteriales bacterium]